MSKDSSRSTNRGGTHRVAILLGEGSNPLEMSIAAEVFGLRRPELGFAPYELIVCAEGSQVTLRDSVFSIATDATLDDALRSDTIIVPNRPDPLTPQTDQMLATIRSAKKRNRRIIGFCTGAFTMGDAGILRGHTVTMHWRWADAFSQRFPGVDFNRNVLFVDDDAILTSAGSASAIDLCLHVVKNDFGVVVAQSVSRRLVFSMNRPGGQQQFIETTAVRSSDEGIAALCQAVLSKLDEDLSVAVLAERVAMAPSTFHRKFVEQVGVAPMTWLRTERIVAARRLLESTTLTVEEVATRVGLGSSTNLRVHFNRQVGLPPTSYRNSF